MKLTVLIAAMTGFVVPIVWTIAAFALFSARQSVWTDLFWSAVHITCPFWGMSGSTTGIILVPFLNAVFYALAAYAFARVVSVRTKRA